MIGSSPKIQEKVLEELDAIFDGDRTRTPTMKDLNEMKYLECAIKDSLRLYPSVPFLGRHLNEDVQIGNFEGEKDSFWIMQRLIGKCLCLNMNILGEYLIPAGTTALISTYVLHRDAKVFRRPEVFNPDNFLPENCIGRNPYAYIPFSAGPRNCTFVFKEIVF